MKITLENFATEYVDPIEQLEIDKFVCNEMSRQIHRYIKAMSGTKQAMLRFEENLSSLTVPEKEEAIAKYIDLNRRALDGLDFKVILARAIANYCDTYQYMLEFINNKRKMIYYYVRMKEKYIRFHEVFEKDGKFGIKDYKGDILISPSYDFLRPVYVYTDDGRPKHDAIHRPKRRQDGTCLPRRERHCLRRFHLRRDRVAGRVSLL